MPQHVENCNVLPTLHSDDSSNTRLLGRWIFHQHRPTSHQLPSQPFIRVQYSNTHCCSTFWATWKRHSSTVVNGVYFTTRLSPQWSKKRTAEFPSLFKHSSANMVLLILTDTMFVLENVCLWWRSINVLVWFDLYLLRTLGLERMFLEQNIVEDGTS